MDIKIFSLGKSRISLYDFDGNCIEQGDFVVIVKNVEYFHGEEFNHYDLYSTNGTEMYLGLSDKSYQDFVVKVKNNCKLLKLLMEDNI